MSLKRPKVAENGLNRLKFSVLVSKRPKIDLACFGPKTT